MMTANEVLTELVAVIIFAFLSRLDLFAVATRSVFIPAILISFRILGLVGSLANEITHFSCMDVLRGWLARQMSDTSKTNGANGERHIIDHLPKEAVIIAD